MAKTSIMVALEAGKSFDPFEVDDLELSTILQKLDSGKGVIEMPLKNGNVNHIPVRSISHITVIKPA